METSSEHAQHDPVNATNGAEQQVKNISENNGSSTNTTGNTNPTTDISTPSISVDNNNNTSNITTDSTTTASTATTDPSNASTNNNTATTTTTTTTVTDNVASSSDVSNGSSASNVINAENNAEKVVYEGKVITKQNRLIALTLRNDSLMWNEKGFVSIILLSTVIGVTTMDKFFTVHIIARSKKNVRTKETASFKCQNVEQAKAWADAIHNVLNQGGKGPHGCRVVFVVNPFSGTKKALSMLASVRHLFDIAGMHITVIETDRAGHAREIGRDINLATVDRLVCVSGDGLFNELINGLLEREDWENAIKLPLGIVPAGSGNGIAASLGTPNAVAAALAIIKGHMRPVDILRTTQNGKAFYGFLSLTWAMISDVDIESDKLRWMGPARFSVGALKRIISLRKYKGKITFLPAPNMPEPHPECVSFANCARCKDDHVPIPAQVREDGKRVLPNYLYDVTQPPPADWRVIDDEFVVFIATNVAWISTDFLASLHAHLSDGAVDLVLVRAKPELTRAKMVSLLLQTDDGKYINSPLVEHYKVKALYLEPGHHSNISEHKSTEGCIIAVDGERVPYTPVGLEVFRGLINMLSIE